MSFSIITPSFRQLEWLKLCAASVADQAGVQVEHIVQDAGGDPLVEAWAREQPGLRIFVEPDSGMYDAVNRGLRRAQGDICAYLNCDEQYLPGALAAVARLFETRPEVEVVFGDAVLVDQQGRAVSYRRMVLPGRMHTELLHLSTLTCATFFRRSLLDRGFYFDDQWRTLADALWVSRLLRAGVKMAVLPEPVAAFTFTGNNLGTSAEAVAEGNRLRKERGWAPSLRVRLLSGALAVHHRLRKLRAGAYRRRSLEVGLFTKEQGASKRVYAKSRLGWSWPK